MILLRPLLVLFFFSLPATAADLSKIDRTIAKEPKYQAKPKYCLLVFGPEARIKVWLVLDEDVLYVDRNGNGDLTEEGKKVNGKRLPGQEIQFEAGKILAREGVPSNACLEVLLADHLTFVYCQAQGKPWHRAVVDKTGNLSFGKSPDAAPIIHFNGPLTLAPRFDQPFQRGANPTDLDVMVGTPGLGTGTFARFAHDAVAKDRHPVAEISFPGRDGQPITVRVVLNQRC